MFKLSAALLTAALVAFPANAQSPVWGQCGGQGWTGATTCASGSVCTFSNPYYSQCIPGSQAPAPTSTTTVSGGGGGKPTSTASSSTASPAPTDTTNPYVGYSTFLIQEYVDEVNAAVKNISDATVAAKAAEVASIPVFFWMDVAAKVPVLGQYLAAANAKGGKQLVQAVIYDLPDRDCAAESSAGEYSIANGGAANYKAYIDAIAAQVQLYPNVRVVFVVEPDGLANLVTNLNVQKCANAQTTYTTLVSYAIQKLQFPNVSLYLDAGHAGWLGWPANITPAAQLFASVLKGAGSGAKVRGLATNVSNYNNLRGPEDPAQQPNPNYDEEHYINALAPLLQQNNFPAHFIVDQSRSGVSGLRTAEGDWCNVKGAGLGTRPTTSTGNSLIDAIVWVKPPGESDGTSNSSAPRYDTHCGQSDAAQPAPQAGTWFQDYFVTLVKNANPAL